MKLLSKQHYTSILFAFALATLLGCGGESQRQSIEGIVTFNGEKIPQGSIKFIPTAGKGPSGGALIQNGMFSISPEKGVYVGDFRVEILASKETGRQIKDVVGGETLPERVQYLPEKYNRNSTLTRQITRGHNEFTFDLEP